MQKDSEIPVLTDLIEKGIEISMSDLGLDDDPRPGELGNDIAQSATDPLVDYPALEQTLRRILDKHMDLAWQEIRIALRKATAK